jgi:hypothetical protein
MSDVAAAADPIKSRYPAELEAVRRAYESGCQAGGQDNHILSSGRKKPLLGADEELPALDNL